MRTIFLPLIILISAWWTALRAVGEDIEQGIIYRILYVHVPSAWCSFLWVILGAIFACFILYKGKKSLENKMQAAMELATIYSFLSLATGSIWGKPTWGVWWDWEPRLTTTLILFLSTLGYHGTRLFIDAPYRRTFISSIVSLITVINVPLVYLSVNLWRSLHQVQSFIVGKNVVSSDIQSTLIFNTVAMTLFSATLYYLRVQKLNQEEI